MEVDLALGEILEVEKVAYEDWAERVLTYNKPFEYAPSGPGALTRAAQFRR